jgi:hypothetical protein
MARSFGGELVKGALAGALAVYVMDRADWWMWNQQPEPVRRKIEDARPGGMDPAHVLANRIAKNYGRELMPVQPHPAGIATHYAIGVAPTILYALLRRRLPFLTAACGLLWGLGLFVVEDEVVNTKLGLSGPPEAYPWQAHARGFASHLVLGFTAEIALTLLSGLPGRRR